MGKLKFLLSVVSAVLLMFSFVIASSAEEMSGVAKGKSELMEKCGKCHKVDRPLSKSKTKEEWDKTVKRMQSKAKDSISDENVNNIVLFLSTKSLFDKKCAECHKTDRALGKNKNREGWTKTVQRMRKKKIMFDKTWMSEEEETNIIDYLSSERGE